MANPGAGYRTVGSLAIEISFHLLQPLVVTSLTQAISSGSNVAAPVVSTLNMYAGALLLVDPGANQEVVTVISLGVGGSPPTPSAFYANFSLPHSFGAQVIAATFPLQAATDALYTQAEVLQYIARAQNQFLMDCPCVYQLTEQNVAYAQIIQLSPLNMVEIERIASSAPNTALTSLTRSGNVVSAVSVSPHGLVAGQKFSVFGASDVSFSGAFSVGTVIGLNTWTYAQVGTNASATGGNAGLWSRLYELTQEELSAQNPTWRSQHITHLSSFYEDRTGSYSFGVNGIPASTFPVEILASIRDSDTLALTDGFLVPDVCLHGVKYKALEFCFLKEGEMRDPLRASYCNMRYQRLVLAVRRWMEGMGIIVDTVGLSQLASERRR